MRSESDLEPHMKVAQITFEKIRFHVIWAVQVTQLEEKKNQVWATRLGVRTVLITMLSTLLTHKQNLTTLHIMNNSLV